MTDGDPKYSPSSIEWYFSDGTNRSGPISSAQLTSMAKSGEITASTLLWRQGLEEWAPAGQFEGLIPDQVAPSAPPPPVTNAIPHVEIQPRQAADHSHNAEIAVQKAKQHATEVIRGLQEWDIKNELFPLQAAKLNRLVTDPVFWSVVLLGGIPLLIGTLEQQTHQLVAFALFFAGLWGVIFRYFIVRPTEDHWGLWVGSLLFTGIVGIFVLLLTYSLLPDAYITMPMSENSVVFLVRH